MLFGIFFPDEDINYPSVQDKDLVAKSFPLSGQV